MLLRSEIDTRRFPPCFDRIPVVVGAVVKLDDFARSGQHVQLAACRAEPGGEKTASHHERFAHQIILDQQIVVWACFMLPYRKCKQITVGRRLAAVQAAAGKQLVQRTIRLRPSNGLPVVETQARVG